jgi:hypothetical protein
MNDPESEGVAVLCDPQGRAAPLVDAYLRASGVTGATWYAPPDVDDMEHAVRAGKVQRIVFPETTAFLAPLWDEVLTPETWQTLGVRVEFARSDDALTPAQLAGVVTSWQRWRRRRHRQRAIAGLILSAVAIAAAWVLVALAR